MPKLKMKLNQDEYEALGEAQREYYVASGSGYMLDADGVEDVGGLKSALEKQKKEVRELKVLLQEKVELYKDIDPETARDALAKIRKLDEKSLLDEGKIEELFKQRLTSTQREHDAKLKALQSDIDARNERISALTQRLSKTALTAQLAQGATEARVDPEWFDYVNLKAQTQWRLDEAGELAPYDGESQLLYGKDGKPMTMTEWISVLAKDKPKILLPNAGGGANGSNGRPGGQFVISREDARNNQKYEQAKQAAEKAGQQLQVSD